MRATRQLAAILLTAVALFFSPYLAAQDDTNPQVKKSNSAICHEKGSTYYKRTKYFKPYPSMQECIRSGGRKPKR